MEKNESLYVFFRHHKCAGTWMNNICKQVSASIKCNYAYLPQEINKMHGKPVSSELVNEFIHIKNIGFCSYGNTPREIVDGLSTFKGFNIIRDPRDMAVSAYFSHLYTHETTSSKKIGELRKKFHEMSLEDGIMLEIESFMPYIFRMMYEWDYSNKNILELKFEQITIEPEKKVPQIFEFLGILDRLLSRDQLHKIIERNSFKKLSGGRNINEEDKKSHYRKGIVGDWVNYFTIKHKRRFKELYSDLLIKLNYAEDNNW